MNELESKASDSKETPSLSQQASALQRQVTTLLLAMVLLTGTFAVYLYQQQKYAIQDRDANKQTVAQMLQVFQQQKPILNDFTAKLMEFGRTRPDFTQILTRYGIQPATMPAKDAPKAAPIPTTIPKK